MPALSERDNGRRITAKVGDELRVSLSEIASAGYRWDVANYDAERLEMLGATGRYAGSATGSAGSADFRFRVIAPGSSILVLQYGREFEPAPLGRFAVTVDAAAN